MHVPNQREIERLLRQAGYRRVRSRKHLIYKHATGDRIALANSPSDQRHWHNLITYLRRKGIA